MLADLPHTLYKDKEKVKQEDIDEATRLTIEAAERKRKEREMKEDYTVEEVFSGEADKNE